MRRKRSGGEGESKWRRREQVRGREQVERERAGREGESRWRGREQVERERAGGKGESRWNVTIGSEEIGSLSTFSNKHVAGPRINAQ